MPLQIIRQDITKMRVDAIVNTTNEQMVGYSGVDLAIHTAAGAALDAECAMLAPLAPGQAKMTGGYGLPAKHVIHTAGPIWLGGSAGEGEILRSCYIESLRLAEEKGCQTVAFPLISSGVYGYPKDQVLKFAIQTITEFLFEHELTVYLCVFDRESYSFSQKLFSDIREFINDEYVAACDGGFYSRSTDCEMRESRRRAPVSADECFTALAADEGISLENQIRERDKGFGEMLFDLIDSSGMTDVACYKRANVDKRVFSKIKSNRGYRPSKPTAVAFAIALHLDLAQTQALLASAGLTLSKSIVFDVIIGYFIEKGIYDVFEINEALFEFDQPLLGCV